MDVIKATVCMNDDCMNKAVMDLVFGELAEQARVPWCQHCICPDTWDTYPFHHADSYSHSEKEISVEKCEVTGCQFNARPFDNLCEEHADRFRQKTDTLGVIIGEAQKVISSIADVIKENFIPKMPSSLGPIEKTTEESLSKAFKVDEKYALQGNIFNKDVDTHKFTVKHDTKALYNRQPHYEGGIDPITFGKDNLSGTEMGGFYKMNVIKYVARCDRKNGLEDLQKARDYLNLLIEVYENRSKSVEYEDILMTEEEERALKEAELCVDRFHADLGVEIKRADVLEIVQERLKEYSYEILSCGDGTTYIAKSPGELI